MHESFELYYFRTQNEMISKNSNVPRRLDVGSDDSKLKCCVQRNDRLFFCLYRTLEIVMGGRDGRCMRALNYIISEPKMK